MKFKNVVVAFSRTTRLLLTYLLTTSDADEYDYKYAAKFSHLFC